MGNFRAKKDEKAKKPTAKPRFRNMKGGQDRLARQKRQMDKKIL